MDRPPNPPVSPGPQRAWTEELALRVRRHSPLKALGISAFMWVFFIGYFHLLRNPAHPVAIMPLTVLDRWIPFQPQALPAYVSLWLYIGVAPGLLLTLRELVAYTLWIATLCLAGLACFYFWPSAVPALATDVSSYPGFSLLQGVDSSGNACPSLHVATAMFTAIWVDYLLRHLRMPVVLRLLNGAWFAAITYSTLATKQHVVLDALAGTLLGIAVAWPSLRWHPPLTMLEPPQNPQ
jgi:membrane-associated phospholipid phosphatase